MKCVCGYEYERVGLIHQPDERDKGDKKFIKVGIKATIAIGDYHKHLEDVSIFACPKCNTLQISRY